MQKTPVPEGFTIAFCRGKRWTWKQIYKVESPDHVPTRGGFLNRRLALADLHAELGRRRTQAAESS